MEYIICCACSLLCFVCGVWAARGTLICFPRKKKQQADVWSQEDDTLSRDIAQLLAYTGPKKEEDANEDA